MVDDRAREAAIAERAHRRCWKEIAWLAFAAALWAMVMVVYWE